MLFPCTGKVGSTQSKEIYLKVCFSPSILIDGEKSKRKNKRKNKSKKLNN